jgi:hypothetical protein
MALQIKDRRAVPEGLRKKVPTTKAISEGREGAGGGGDDRKLEDTAKQDSKLPREVALGADRDLISAHRERQRHRDAEVSEPRVGNEVCRAHAHRHAPTAEHDRLPRGFGTDGS